MTSPQEQLTTLMNSGKEDLSKDDYASAELSFEGVIELAPLFPEAYLNCATAQFLQQKNDAALVNLDIAVTLLPQGEGLAAAYHNRALVHIELNNLNEALIDLKAAKSLEFEAAEVELERVKQLLKEDTSSSTEDFSKKVQAFCNLARKEYSTKPLHSLALFKKALDLDPDSIDAIFGMALADSALGRIDQALESFDEVLTRVDKSPTKYAALKAEIFYHRSAIYKHKGEMKQAVVDLDSCLQLSLDDTVSFPILGSHEKENEMIIGIKNELEEWKKELN